MSIVCYDSNDVVITKLYQWDIDRKIRLVGDELTGVTEVHMTNKGQRNAVHVAYSPARTGILVTVPNFLLRKTDPLVIYLYQEMAGTEERTVYELQIPIARRAMPVGYVDSEAWSGSDRIFETIDLDDYLLAQEDSLRGKITVRKVVELAGVDALADRVSAIEGQESGWNAKYGPDTAGGIPIHALSAETQLEIYAGRQAYDALDYKVDKVTGKGLSTNDYDNTAKAKVDAIPENPHYTDTTYTAGTGINISEENVISATGGGGSEDAVLYTEQSLTAAQKAQARENIAAVALTDAATEYTLVVDSRGTVTCDAAKQTVGAAFETQNKVMFRETVDSNTSYWYTLEKIDNNGLHLIATVGSTIRYIVLNGDRTMTGTLTEITVPDELSDLSDDSTHRLVTDTEKSAWNAKADAVTEVTVSTTGAVTQALDAGKMYHFTGALTSLTITFNAASGIAQYHFDFTEGSTAFDPTLPNGVKLPDNHTWEADTHYEVDILNGYAVVVGRAVS